MRWPCGGVETKKFQCPQCGYTAHRDWNGARNIS
ncbi:MAG: transposase [Okeania sp. SIO2D1]|nr:transposase [Okeania sp. SIO2D1]